MDKFKLIQLLNKVELAVGETVMSKKIKEHINELILDVKNEAINYTHCCTELKDKESQAFEDWIDFEGYRDEYNDLLSNGFAYDIGLLHKKHNEFLKHSL